MTSRSTDADNRVVWLVPRRAYVFLDYDFSSFVAGAPALFPLACRLFEAGHTRVGDVVQLRGDALNRFAEGRADLVAEVTRRLGEVGLRLGMATAHWTRPTSDLEGVQRMFVYGSTRRVDQRARAVRLEIVRDPATASP